MKKILTLLCSLFLISNIAFATNLDAPYPLLNNDLMVLTKGEGFSYPLPEGAIIACYAKKIDGSVDDFTEYNDYFVMRNNHLYSNTMHKIYKPHKEDKLKKVDSAKLLSDNITLKLYDPLWEWSIRHHVRTIKINTLTGAYYMKGTQDNWYWYRNIETSGYCKVIYPENL